MNTEEIVSAVEQLLPDDLQKFLETLLGVLPLQALITLAQSVAKEISAKTEKEQMQEAVKAVDAEVDLEEAADIKLGNPA